jgi:hypothetical protein
MRIWIGSFLIFLIAGNAIATNPYATPGFDVSRERFFDFLRKEAPQEFCASDSHFMKCFSVTNGDCSKEVQRQIDQCHNSLRVPEKFDVLDVDAQAERIGACVGNNLQKKWQAQKAETSECRQRL